MNRRLLPALCAAAMLATLWSAGVVWGAWFCEGRQCGATPLLCCCEGPAPARDGQCLVPAPTDGHGGCRSACGCVWVVSPGSTVDAAQPPQPGWPAALALLPAPTWAPGIAPAPRVVRQLEARGPPGRPAAHRIASPRAPPPA